MTAHDLPAAARNDLDAGLQALNLDPALAVPLSRYLALLLRWNAAYNLTAIRDPREMVTKHLLDSLAMAPFVASIRTRRFCAAVIVSAAIFIGDFSGSATGIASMRRIVSGA